MPTRWCCLCRLGASRCWWWLLSSALLLLPLLMWRLWLLLVWLLRLLLVWLLRLLPVWLLWRLLVRRLWLSCCCCCRVRSLLVCRLHPSMLLSIRACGCAASIMLLLLWLLLLQRLLPEVLVVVPQPTNASLLWVFLLLKQLPGVLDRQQHRAVPGLGQQCWCPVIAAMDLLLLSSSAACCSLPACCSSSCDGDCKWSVLVPSAARILRVRCCHCCAWLL